MAIRCWVGLAIGLIWLSFDYASATDCLDNECYTDDKARDYRGCVNVTVTGRICQKWSRQYPHSHGFSLISKLGIGDHNFCRNPDNEKTAWCYTTDPTRRWEYCAIPDISTTCDQGLYNISGTDNYCIDAVAHCSYWANNGYCDNQYSDYMNANCRLSCDICDYQDYPAFNEQDEWLLEEIDSPFHGYLQLKLHNTWRYLCLWHLIDDNAALSHIPHVACRQLGFGPAISGHISEPRTSGDSAFFDSNLPFRCNGNEETLRDCLDDNDYWHETFCDSGMTLELQCAGSPSLQLRLTGGEANNTGQIQIFDGVLLWGTLCSPNFGQVSEHTADLLCQHMGFSSGVISFGGNTYGQPIGKQFLYGINCDPGRDHNGIDECFMYIPDRLSPCGCNGDKITNIICQTDESSFEEYHVNGIQLVEGHHYNTGFLMIRTDVDDIWRHICYPSDIKGYQNVDFSDILCIDQTRVELSAYITIPNSVKDSAADGVYVVRHWYSWLQSENRDTNDKYSNDNSSDILNSLALVPGNCSAYNFIQLHTSCSNETTVFGIDVPIYPSQTCENRCGTSEPNPVSCHCDSDCIAFQDCCFDYTLMCETGASKENGTELDFSMYHCVRINGKFSVKLIDRCMDDWNLNSIKLLCEAFIDGEFTQWPFYDINGYNYKNIFCAICNNHDPGELKPWAEDKSVQMDGCLTQDAQLTAGPYRLHTGYRLRHCRYGQKTLLISECPDSFNGSQEIRSACRSYSAETCGADFPPFKNPHCRLCHNANLVELKYCPTNLFVSAQGFRGGNTLWDFTIDDKSDRNDLICPDGMVFDAVSMTCRALLCPIGFQLTRNQCVKNVALNVLQDLDCQKTSSKLLFQFFHETLFYGYNDYRGSVACVLEIIKEKLGLRNVSLVENEYRWPYTFDRFYGSFEHRNTFMIEISKTNDYDLILALEESLLTEYMIYTCGVNHFQLLTVCDKSLLQSCRGSWFESSSKHVSDAKLPFNTDILLVNDLLVQPELLIHYTTLKHINITVVKKSDTFIICGKIFPKLTLKCPYVVLNQTEFERDVVENSTFIIHQNRRINQNESLLLPDGRLLLCVFNIRKITSGFFTYSGILDSFDIASSCVSMTALAATLITYLYLTELQSLYGKGLMNLVLALFMSHLLPLLSRIPASEAACVGLAAFTHYMWLTSFTWMTILSFDLAQRFAFKPLKLQSQSAYKFAAYILCGWGSPCLVTIPCLAIHFVDGTGLTFQYGSLGNTCWISPSFSNFVAFGIPAACSLLINAVLYVITAGAVIKANRSSMKLLRKDPNKTVDIVLTAKMSSVMGFSWAWGFVAGFCDIEALWWIFVVLNAYQGVFIFVSYAMNKRVRKLWENKFTKLAQKNDISDVQLSVSVQTSDKMHNVK